MGLLLSRFGPRRVVLSMMLIAFGIMLVYGNAPLNFLLMFILIYFIGFFVQGGFNGFYPIATKVYPSEMRSTGVGFAMGIGRFGAILGPALFGLLQDWQVSTPTLFSLFSVPLLVAGYMAYSIPSKNL